MLTKDIPLIQGCWWRDAFHVFSIIHCNLLPCGTHHSTHSGSICLTLKWPDLLYSTHFWLPIRLICLLEIVSCRFVIKCKYTFSVNLMPNLKELSVMLQWNRVGRNYVTKKVSIYDGMKDAQTKKSVWMRGKDCSTQVLDLEKNICV